MSDPSNEAERLTRYQRALDDVYERAVELETLLGEGITREQVHCMMRIFSAAKWRKRPEWTNRYPAKARKK